MKYHTEKFHPSLVDSLRAHEKPKKEAGDPVAIKRDMSAEQRAAFQQPQETDSRVENSEADQGRTK